MKRSEIESRLLNVKSECLRRIESAPLASFGAGLLIGMLVMAMPQLIITLVFIVAVVIGVFWMMADKDSEGAGYYSSSYQANAEPKTNGHDSTDRK